jgi:hypothetical protein
VATVIKASLRVDRCSKDQSAHLGQFGNELGDTKTAEHDMFVAISASAVDADVEGVFLRSDAKALVRLFVCAVDRPTYQRLENKP